MTDRPSTLSEPRAAVAEAKPPAPVPGAAALVIGQCLSILDQCEGLLAAVEPQAFTAPSSRMQSGTIGKHIRHTLDHFSAPLAALAGEPIDYDHRVRGTSVESDPSAARAQLREVRDSLASLGEHNCGRKVVIRVMVSGCGQCADLESTLARELAFASHHAVHHLAMITTIAGEFGLAMPEGFGKAPSTIAHDRVLRR